jgi:hypothetical protein
MSKILFDHVEPRQDVLSGVLSDSMFAASLDEVVAGHGPSFCLVLPVDNGELSGVRAERNQHSLGAEACTICRCAVRASGRRRSSP